MDLQISGKKIIYIFSYHSKWKDLLVTENASLEMEASFSVLWSGFFNANSHRSGEVRNSEAKYQNLLQGSITEILLVVEIIPLKVPVGNTVWTKCLPTFPLTPHPPKKENKKKKIRKKTKTTNKQKPKNPN